MRLTLALLLLLLRAGVSSGDLRDRLPLTATAPRLDDEEKFSTHMPAHLRCDACRAVAYQMWQHLANAEAKLQSRGASGQLELSESEYTDVLDRSCTQPWQERTPGGSGANWWTASTKVGDEEHVEGWVTKCQGLRDLQQWCCFWCFYGIREVNQVKRLTGPGLSKDPEPRISVVVKGALWPIRLSRTCLHYVGEFGEDQIYETYREGQEEQEEGQEALEALLCEGPRGACLEELLATREEL